MQPKQLVIQLSGEPSATASCKRTGSHGVLGVPWQTTPSTRRREILLPEGTPPQHARPIRSETRATLVAAIARGRRWLDELTTDASISSDSIAKREGCSVRKVNMTISLAFLAPDIVKAAIDGRLPHGMGVTRLTDLPAEWSRQREMLGFPSH
jgi:site-specific DNA recombinase